MTAQVAESVQPHFEWGCELFDSRYTLSSNSMVPSWLTMGLTRRVHQVYLRRIVSTCMGGGEKRFGCCRARMLDSSGPAWR